MESKPVSNFQSSSGGGRSRFLLLLYSASEKNWKDETCPLSFTVQKINNERTVSHTNNQAGAVMCFPGRLVHSHRPERCVLPRLHHPKTKQIPTFLIPFGYSLAPSTFSRCVETALEPLCWIGMRVLFYLDDLHLLARSGGGGRAVLQKAKLVMHLSSNKVEKEFSSPLPECNSSE